MRQQKCLATWHNDGFRSKNIGTETRGGGSSGRHDQLHSRFRSSLCPLSPEEIRTGGTRAVNMGVGRVRRETMDSAGGMRVAQSGQYGSRLLAPTKTRRRAGSYRPQFPSRTISSIVQDLRGLPTVGRRRAFPDSPTATPFHRRILGAADSGAGGVPYGRRNQIGTALLDSDISPLFEYHKRGQSKEFIEGSQSTYQREAPFTTVDKGVLYYRALIGSDTCLAHATIVPTALVPQVMRAVHDSADVGHPGEKITAAIAREQAYWRGMAKAIKKYIQECKVCKRTKMMVRMHAGKQLSDFYYTPWERVGIDLVGPLPITEDGQQYIFPRDLLGHVVQLH